MEAQTRLKINRPDVPAVFFAARPYPHKCLVAQCLSSNLPTDGSASSEIQNLRLHSKSRGRLQANKPMEPEWGKRCVSCPSSEKWRLKKTPFLNVDVFPETMVVEGKLSFD